jgi:regulator of sirC expression with transglutaminase-like and TPR domain
VLDDFRSVAARPDATLDLLSLSLAAEFREVDGDAALRELDRLGAELEGEVVGSPREDAEACGRVLGVRHGFVGNRERYDDPDNSMLDLVLERRTGLPILLAVVYVEVSRRAGVLLDAIGLPGHFVVGYLDGAPPVVLDPFSRGRIVTGEVRSEGLRSWRPHETALRMLNNLVGSYLVRGDVGRAVRAAELRLALPLAGELRDRLQAELRGIRARLN